MAVVLSECAKAFIRFVTGRVRQQLKLLLQTFRQLIQIELATLVATIGRMDFIASGFQNKLNLLLTLLEPIEAQLTQLPFEELRGCAQLEGTLGELENLYFDKKAELLDIVYKQAQFGFASSRANDIRNRLENQLDIVEAMIRYIDGVAALELISGSSVYVYTKETDLNGNSYPVTRGGIIQGAPGITVDVLMDDTGQVETFNATEIQHKP